MSDHVIQMFSSFFFFFSKGTPEIELLTWHGMHMVKVLPVEESLVCGPPTDEHSVSKSKKETQVCAQLIHKFSNAKQLDTDYKAVDLFM